MRLSFLIKSNLSSVRRVKSSQGSRRGTCGWITSFYFFYLFLILRINKTSKTGLLHFYFHTQHLYSMGPQLNGRALPLQGRGFGFKKRRAGFKTVRCLNVPTGPFIIIQNHQSIIHKSYSSTLHKVNASHEMKIVAEGSKCGLNWMVNQSQFNPEFTFMRPCIHGLDQCCQVEDLVPNADEGRD